MLLAILGTLFYIADSNMNTSSLKSHAFLKAGSAVDSGKLPSLSSADIQKYYKAMHRFATSNDCKAESQNLPEAQLQWDKIGGLEDLEVCLFLIANDLRNITSVSKFLNFNNFRAPHFNPMSGINMQFYGGRDEGIQIQTGLRGKDIPSSVLSFFSFPRPYSMAISIIVDKGGMPMDVDASLNRW